MRDCFPKCTNYALKFVSYCVFTATPFTSNDPICMLQIQHLCHFALAKMKRNIEWITVWTFGYWHFVGQQSSDWTLNRLSMGAAILFVFNRSVASDVYLPKKDKSGGKIREASEEVEYEIYFWGIWILF